MRPSERTAVASVRNIVSSFGLRNSDFLLRPIGMLLVISSLPAISRMHGGSDLESQANQTGQSGMIQLDPLLRGSWFLRHGLLDRHH